MKILLTNYHCRAKTVQYRPGFFGRELVRRGHDVTILCTSDTRRTGIDEKVEEGLRYVEVPDLFWGKLRTGWDVWNLLNRSAYLRKQHFDLVHSFETRPATIHPVRSYLKRTPTPLVIDWIDWWGRGGLIKEQRPLWYQWFFGWFETYYEEHFRTMADATSVISHALGDRAVSLGVARESVCWIPNGCPVESFVPAAAGTHRREFGFPEDGFILADSALDVTIGMDLVFQAVKIVREQCPQVLFVMTGDKERELQDLAAKTGISGNFRHLGRLPYDQYARIMSCADAFVMPYTDCVANRGRWPGRIGPYLALGRPVVSNAAGEMKFLLETDHVGLAVPETPGGFAEGILELRRRPELAAELGRNARRTAENLSWKNITDRLEECYRLAAERFKSRKA
jgi:glycosyltransferase involved in cell wall biosynthesis